MRHLLFFIFLGLSIQISAQSEAQRKKHFNLLENGVALQGYDPVSYFQYKPQKGNIQFATTYKGVLYWFVSEANKNQFWKNPSYYEPQYGGWCAFAMGDYGKKVEVNPETYKIVDGKLYLFYNAYLNNTLNDWNKNESQLKIKADYNWSQFLVK